MPASSTFRFEPARQVAFTRDHADPGALSLRDGGRGTVQLGLGERVRVTVLDGDDGGGERVIAGSDLGEIVLAGVASVSRLTEGSEATAGHVDADRLDADRLDADRLDADLDATVRAERHSEPVHDLDATIVVAAARVCRPAVTVRVTCGDSAERHPLTGSLYIGVATPGPAAGEAARASAVVASEHVPGAQVQLTGRNGRVLVRDLWSAGGTVLAPPRGDSYRLAPDEQLPVLPGTRLTLAGDVTVEIEESPNDA